MNTASLSIDPRGRWSMRNGRGFALEGLATVLETESRAYRSDAPGVASRGGDARMEFELGPLRVAVGLRGGRNGMLLLSCEVVNVSNETQRLRSVTPFAFEGLWDDAGPLTLPCDAELWTCPAERCYGFEGPHGLASLRPATSCWFISLRDPAAATSIVAGVAGPPNGFVRFRARPLLASRARHRVLRLRCDIDTRSGMRGLRLEPGARFETGDIALYRHEGPPGAAMDPLAALLAASCGSRRAAAPLSGWCSWYAGYAEHVTEADCLRNLEDWSALPIDVVQVDDGWTRGEGTRRGGEPEVDRDAFPRGMEALAADIRARGPRAGLWLRPFQPWSGPDAPDWARGPCMDLSRPEALAWLRGLARRAVEDWGYSYLKLDFLAHDFYGAWGMEMLGDAAAPLEPARDDRSSVQLYRDALAALREGAGDGAFLLGCNALVAPSMGLVDALRIGDDVDARDFERTVAMGLRSIAPMQFLNGAVWWNDPDCLLFQEPMTLAQLRLWSTAVAVCGGMHIASSVWDELDEERRDVARRVLPGLPLRFALLGQRDGASLWRARAECPAGPYTLLALLNPGPGDAAFPLPADDPPPGAHVYDVWENRYLGTLREPGMPREPGAPRADGPLRAAAGTALLLRATPPGATLTVVGTEGHLSQGAYEGLRLADDGGGAELSAARGTPLAVSVHDARAGRVRRVYLASDAGKKL